MMKKILLNVFCVASTLTLGAQNIDVSGFTKLDVNILSTPKQGAVVPTSDGGYFWARGLKVTKFNASNAEEWSTTLEGTNRVGYIHTITALADDGNGGAIITGNVNGTLSFGNDSITPFYTATGSGLYSADAFIARVNSTGKTWWHRIGEYSQDALGTDRGIDVKVVGDKVYWLAHVTGRNFKFGNNMYPLNQYGNNVTVLAQFGLDGTNNWAVVTKGGGTIPKYLVAGNNQVAIGAYSLGSSTAIDFGNNKTLRYNQASHLLAKFNTSGEAQWAVTYDDDNNETNLYGLTVDDEGNYYACGMASNFTSSYQIKKGQGYLVKMSGTDGAHVWTRVLSKIAGASNVLHGPLLGAQFVNGKVYVCGNTNGNLYLQSGATDSVEVKLSSNLLAAEQFVAQYDKTGSLTSIVKATGGLAGGTMEYLAQANNKLIGVGVFSASLVFGSHNMPATGGNVGAYFIGFYQLGTGSTGLNKVSNQFVSSVYPNPANGLVNIETDLGNSIDEVLVTDITGKLYQVSVAINANLATLNLRELNSGLYFVTIKSKAGNSTQKIIKE